MSAIVCRTCPSSPPAGLLRLPPRSRPLLQPGVSSLGTEIPRRVLGQCRGRLVRPASRGGADGCDTPARGSRPVCQPPDMRSTGPTCSCAAGGRSTGRAIGRKRACRCRSDGHASGGGDRGWPPATSGARVPRHRHPTRGHPPGARCRRSGCRGWTASCAHERDRPPPSRASRRRPGACRWRCKRRPWRRSRWRRRAGGTRARCRSPVGQARRPAR